MDEINKPVEKNWVTLRKLSIIIQKSYPTTRKLVDDGRIAAIRVGGQYRIYEHEVFRFLREGNHPNPVPLKKSPT